MTTTVAILNVIKHKILGKWAKIVCALLLVWVVLLLTVSVSLMRNVPSDGSSDGPGSADLGARLKAAIREMEVLKRQNNHVMSLLESMNTDDFSSQKRSEMLKSINEIISESQDSKLSGRFLDEESEHFQHIAQKKDPSSEYEHLRRRIFRNIKELWNYVKAELDKMKSHVGVNDGLKHSIEDVLALAGEFRRSLYLDMEKVAEVDGYEKWRETEMAALSDIVQKRFQKLQNPADCKTAKKLLCSVNKGCGFGCQLHHVAYCLVMAYATKRTLILQSSGWRYHSGGWDEVFQPVSNSCTTDRGGSRRNFPGDWDTQVVVLPIVEHLTKSNQRDPVPLAVPADIGPRLLRAHGDPSAWWVGQLLKFLLRPKPQLQGFLDGAMAKLNFRGPIVGVHVRRTDKVGTEAAFHKLEEYMIYVDDYYTQLELRKNIDVRRVYLASDDPKVIKKAKVDYPNYEIIGDPSVAETAALSTRYTYGAFKGILLDIYLLARCDYLVCTFSSQVCRVAYEIMQSLRVDGADKFRSLDDIYYFGGQNGHNVMALLPHNRRPGTDEISMEVGDLVGIAGNHWNGFSKGINRRTKRVGLFPHFKTSDKVDLYDFPAYEETPPKDSAPVA